MSIPKRRPSGPGYTLQVRPAHPISLRAFRCYPLPKGFEIQSLLVAARLAQTCDFIIENYFTEKDAAPIL